MAGRFRMADDESWALLARSTQVDLAGQLDGKPLLRTLHCWLHQGKLWFHSSPKGEKHALASGPVVVAATEPVVRIPSWMRHPERACPATTYYRSVQAHGILVAETEAPAKAAALQAFMEQHQPEGGYRPITHEDPMYRASVKGLTLYRLEVGTLSGVAKLGQNLAPAEMQRILDGLWQRGATDDMRAIHTLQSAYPTHLRIAGITLPDGFELRVHPSSRDLDQAVDLLEHTYWNQGRFTRTQLLAAHRNSHWLGIRKQDKLVATCRFISDSSKYSWLYDVAVEPELRGQGLGGTLIRVARRHPSARNTHMLLGTRDAQAFYRQLGFIEHRAASTVMLSSPQ